MNFLKSFCRNYLYLLTLLLVIVFQIPTIVEAYFWVPQTDVSQKAWTSIVSSDDGTKVAATISNGSIWTSTTSGVTWTEQTGSGSRIWLSLASDSSGTKLVAGAFGGYIYTSPDSGVTWNPITDAGTRVWKSITSSSNGEKLVAVVNNGYIYTSTTSGAVWTAQTGLGSKFWYSAASSDDGSKVFAVENNNGAMGYIYRSMDSGITWASSTSAGLRNWQSIVSDSTGVKLAATAYGGYIYTSTTSGATWATSTGAGSRNWTSITSSANGMILAATEDSGYIYMSLDGGGTWQEQVSSSLGSLSTITTSSDGKTLFAASNPGYIYLSSPISQPEVVTTKTTATVTFNTVDNSNSTISYGLTKSYGSTISSGTTTTTHSALITGLICGTTYHYKVSAIDGASKESSLVDSTFATASCSGAVMVTTLADDGDGTCTLSKCTLRDAIETSLSGATIEFGNLSGEIILHKFSNININKNLTITGPGSDILAINFNGSAYDYINHSGGDLSISGLTIKNGGDEPIYGSISSPASLTLNDLKFINNTGYSAVSVYGYSGDVVINNCEFINNNETGYGGGGAVYARASNLIINNSTFSGNVSNYQGGAIYFDSFGGNLTITNSTFSNNTAPSYGLIYSSADLTTITNSTFYNSDSEQDYSLFIGGLSLISNTIFSSISNNNCAGSSYTSGGHNIDSGTSCGFANTGDISTDPLLDPLGLKDNGGFVQTIAIATGSPAIDMGDNVKAPATDARGISRPQDGDNNGTSISDIGAYEVETTLVSDPTPDPTPSPTPDPTPAPLIQNKSLNNSSGGSTIFSRVKNLIAIGNIKAANDLKKQYSFLFPYESPTLITTNTSAITGTSKAATNNFFKKDLSFGMVNSDVKELQKFLNSNGFNVATTGVGSVGKETLKFGPATRSALIRYQKANNILPSIGYFGVKTRSVVQK